MGLFASIADRALDAIGDRDKRPLQKVVGGMFLLAAGQKALGIPIWLSGLKDMEARWRAAHPEFEGGVRERLRLAIEFHDQQHQHPVNRAIHVVGVPMIIGSLAGLIVLKPYRPVWFACSSTFVAGWVLNLVGHKIEGKRPALASDPVAAYIAGPWIYTLSTLVGDDALTNKTPARTSASPGATVSAGVS